MKLKFLLITLTVLVLFACSDESTDSAQVNNNDTKKPAKHMLSEHERALQKAKEVEKKLQEADEKRRKALKDSGG